MKQNHSASPGTPPIEDSDEIPACSTCNGDGCRTCLGTGLTSADFSAITHHHDKLTIAYVQQSPLVIPMEITIKNPNKKSLEQVASRFHTQVRC